MLLCLGNGRITAADEGGRIEIKQLLFANDTVLLADSEEKLCRLVSELA